MSTLPPIEDPDKDMHSDLMDGRDPFLTKARDEHWEFSSLRRTKYSTMSLLYKLHNPDTKFTAEEYTCNECQTTCTTRYHCKECKDYDLCTKCYQAQQADPATRHQHPLEKIAPGPSLLGGGSNDNGKSQYFFYKYKNCFLFWTYSRLCPEGPLSNRTIVSKISLIREFCFFEVY